MARTLCGFNSSPTVSGTDLLEGLGPTLIVNIGFDPAWLGASGAVPALGLVGLQALVDTGAGESCIDAAVANHLGLPIVDRRPIAGVGGQHMANMYMAQIHVPSINFTIFGAFSGVNLLAGGQRHTALIGRTFLRHFTMIYEGRTGAVIVHNE
jgi:predicted aspartyl protease